MVSERPTSSRRSAAGIKALLAMALTLVLLVLAGGADAVVRQCDPDETCWGTKDPDELIGTAGSERIYGWAGGDVLKGRHGKDVLFGGKGSDRVFGYGGDDKLYAGRNREGYDSLRGGSGDDELHGWSRFDFFYGGQGDDLLIGGAKGSYYVFSPAWGRDVIRDEPHFRNTVRLVDVSDDLLIHLSSKGWRHEVAVDGRSWVLDWDNDAIGIVLTGSGDDRIVGHGGRSKIYAGSGVDNIHARNGRDRVVVEDNEATPDIVNCGKGNDDRVDYDGGIDKVVNCERKYPH